MTDAVSLPASAQIVILGAGIVGCSVAHHLARLGLTDVTVIEQGPLPSPGGSTSHAPGLVFQTNSSRTMARLAMYSVGLYKSLKREDGLSCFLGVGGMEVATTPARWEELKRKRGWAQSWGIESELLTPKQTHAKNSLIDPSAILGAYYCPADGLAKAVLTCETMAVEARREGVRFFGDTEITGFTVERGRVKAVETTRGRVAAEQVLICGGIWGPKIGKLAGIAVPLSPVQHQYVRTSLLPELAGEMREAVHPILRHQDADLYFRQHGDAYGIGSYAHEPLLTDAATLRRPSEYRPASDMPSVLPFTPEHFAAPLAGACRLIPALSGADFPYRINGLFSFTPDGFPLLGESSVRGLWVAEAVWVTQGGGVGAVMASWLSSGVPSLGGAAIDLSGCDINRFEGYAHSPAYVKTRAAQQYREVYDILHPLEPLQEPRPLKVSPFFARQKELGAFFLEGRGWERPHWYESTPPPEDAPTRAGWAARFWSSKIAGEHRAARERVALFDMTPLTRLEISGPGALAFQQWVTTGEMNRPVGSVTYTLLCNADGGILSDITVARQSEITFLVGCNGPRDRAYLESLAPADNSVTVRDVTNGTCVLGLWGPRSRDVLASLTDADLSNGAFPYLTGQFLFVGEVPVWAQRISYIGELGWELYTDAAYGLRLWDLLWEAGQPHGIAAAGRGALDSLRLEKGCRAYGADMTAEHSPYAAGLGFAVKLAEPDFLGRDALLKIKQEGPAYKLRCLTFLDPELAVLGNEPVFIAGRPAGYVTSANYGYTVGKSVAYAYLPALESAEGTPVEVEYFGVRSPAIIACDPLYDPKGSKMRL